jgi:flagellar biosynthesis protein
MPERPPRKRAIALRYEVDKDAAPVVIAKGQGLLAERILELARANGIHIQEDPDLTALLAQVEVNAAIPAELYAAVAQILAFVYRLNNRLDEVKRSTG